MTDTETKLTVVTPEDLREIISIRRITREKCRLNQQDSLLEYLIPHSCYLLAKYEFSAIAALEDTLRNVQ